MPALKTSDKKSHVYELLEALMDRQRPEDELIHTDCDGTKTISVSDEKNGKVNTVRYTFPFSYLSGGSDTNSTPIAEYMLSENGMLTDYHRKQLTGTLTA